MKTFNIDDIKKTGMSVTEFEVLEDVLSNIEEHRLYIDEDDTALKSLKRYFSFDNYCIYRHGHDL